MKTILKSTKRIFCVLTMTILYSQAFSQVTIGDDSEPRSGLLLDIRENKNLGVNATKGVGIPRISLDDVTILKIRPAEENEIHKGTLIYNVNPSIKGGIGEGLYIWNGSKWVSNEGSTSGWYGVVSQQPLKDNNEDAYLNAKVVVGGDEIKNNAALTVNGAAEISDKLNVTATSALTGNVGIGKVPSTFKLDVNGNTNITGNLYASENIGIGTTAPRGKLDVNGAAYVSDILNVARNVTVSGNLGIGRGATANRLDVNGATNVTGNVTASGNLAITGASTLIGNVGIGRAPSAHMLDISGNTNITGDLWTWGNVGIGTGAPFYKLDVIGGIRSTDEISVGHPINGQQGYGKRLYFRGNEPNTDEMWIAKFTVEYDITELRINIGDNGFDDKLIIGCVPSGTDDWVSSVIINADGGITAREFKTTTGATADFVFEPDYKLPTLEEVEKYIRKNKHLPDIPSAEKMQEEGINVVEFQTKLLQKIEELTLYIIEQEKRIKSLEKNNM